MAHPYAPYREYQASHRRVGTRLKGEPEGATKHATGKAFSNVTSKTAAANHDAKVEGKSAPKRYARGGKVKGSTTNIAIVLPGGDKSEMAEKMPMGAPPMPMPPPGAGGPPGMPPGMPPGLPMRARGGKVDGESTKAALSKWASRAKANSYFRGGAATGVGREEKAAHMKAKRK